MLSFFQQQINRVICKHTLTGTSKPPFVFGFEPHVLRFRPSLFLHGIDTCRFEGIQQLIGRIEPDLDNLFFQKQSFEKGFGFIRKLLCIHIIQTSETQIGKLSEILLAERRQQQQSLIAQGIIRFPKEHLHIFEPLYTRGGSYKVHITRVIYFFGIAFQKSYTLDRRL